MNCDVLSGASELVGLRGTLCAALLLVWVPPSYLPCPPPPPPQRLSSLPAGILKEGSSFQRWSLSHPGTRRPLDRNRDGSGSLMEVDYLEWIAGARFPAEIRWEEEEVAARERETWPKPAPKVPERCNKGPPASVASAAQQQPALQPPYFTQSLRLHKALHHMLSNNFHLVYIAFYCISLNKMLHHMLLPPSIASGFAPLIASTCIANHPILPPSGVSNQHNALSVFIYNRFVLTVDLVTGCWLANPLV